MFGVGNIFQMFLKSHIFLRKAAFILLKYIKNCYIVKYYYNKKTVFYLKIFSNVIYCRMINNLYYYFYYLY